MWFNFRGGGKENDNINIQIVEIGNKYDKLRYTFVLLIKQNTKQQKPG